MFKNIKWWLKRIWNGPESTTHGSSQSDITLLIPNHGGLKRGIKNFYGNIWRLLTKFSFWIIGAVILAAIGFFVPYLLGKWLS